MSHDVIVTVIAGSGAVVVAGLSLIGVVYQSRKTRNEMQTGNGHTLGSAVARIEECLWRHEQRLDSIEVEVRETKADVDEAKGAIRAHIIDVNGSGK